MATGCAWCISQRACRRDEAWQCQGDVDHVSVSGIGKHIFCPSLQTLEELRLRRLARKKQAQDLFEQMPSSPSASATSPSRNDENKDSGSDPKTEKERLHLLELMRRFTLTISSSSSDTDSDSSDSSSSTHTHSQAYGVTHPYETLMVTPSTSSGDIRKAYRRLVLLGFSQHSAPQAQPSDLCHGEF